MLFFNLVQLSIIFVCTLLNKSMFTSAALRADFATDQTALHNAKRALHGVGNLRWNDELATYAKNYGSKCLAGHSQNNQNGENLAFGSPPNAFSTKTLFEFWYDEIRYYDFNTGQFNENTGHFTQVVWKSTNELGCAVVECPASNGWSNSYKELVCEYHPPGNVIGQFQENVFPPKN